MLKPEGRKENDMTKFDELYNMPGLTEESKKVIATTDASELDTFGDMTADEINAYVDEYYKD